MKKAIILLCAVMMVAGSMFVVGCGGSSGGGDDEAQVKEVAEKYAEAVMNNDIEAMVDVLCESDKALMTDEAIEEAKQQAEEEGDTGAEVKVEVGDIEITGDEATAALTMEMSGQQTEMIIILVKENGEWKVDLMKSMDKAMDSLDETLDETVDESEEAPAEDTAE